MLLFTLGACVSVYGWRDSHKPGHILPVNFCETKGLGEDSLAQINSLLSVNSVRDSYILKCSSSIMLMTLKFFV